MAKKTRTELSTLAVNTNLPDNTQELITPTTERAQLTDERESVVNYKDDLGGASNAGKFLTVAVDGESLTMVDAPTGDVTGTGVSGRVTIWDGTNSITSKAMLVLDDTSKILKIVIPSANASGGVSIDKEGTTGSGALQFLDDGVYKSQIVYDLSDGNLTLNSNGDIKITPTGDTVISGGTPIVEHVRISSAGHTTVNNYLTLNGNASGGTGTFMEWRNDTSLFAYTGSAAAILSGGAAADYVVGNTTGSSSVILATNNAERMRIASGGDVTLNGNGTTSALIFGQTSFARIINKVNQTLFVDSDVHEFRTSGGVSKLTIALGGNVKIGLSGTNDSRLFVYGDISTATEKYVGFFYNDGNNSNRYGIKVLAGANNASGVTNYFSAQTTGGEQGGLRNNSGTFEIYQGSDVSLKENIEYTDIKGLDRINALKIRRFNWKKNGVLNAAGFIAQEVKDIIPEASSPMESGLLSISVTSMIPTLVKAIQEQQTIIEDLKARIEKLEL